MGTFSYVFPPLQVHGVKIKICVKEKYVEIYGLLLLLTLRWGGPCMIAKLYSGGSY